MPTYTVPDTEERERRAAAARIRFEQLTLEPASERRFGGPDVASTEVNILEEAKQLVKQSRGAK